ncbi:hypothetical protein PanWU01x14_052140 [Parasponia andersonii]|uniref:Uncharacterized protein n=1 Tax=Parasponia andersonii TaxID=3476 RepID=A0A2P5DM56_PARAD|nr:hypothetical protein PanWU01x14_052140 [Parasponia andersonii]
MYYGELTKIFQELDYRVRVIIKDPDDIKIYRNTIEQLRVHIFLARLDEDFDQIRREILHINLLPNLEECYYLIHREAIYGTTLKGDSGTSYGTTLKGDSGTSEACIIVAQIQSNHN